LLLPQPIARPIRATAISDNEYLLLGWIESAPDGLPPASETLDGKFSSLMVDPNVDKATVVYQIINPIRDGFPICKGAIIVHIDRRLLPLGLPFLSIVFKGADQLERLSRCD
jgi:hypothetical protein